MKTRCPFCHAEVEILQEVGARGYCSCGAYDEIDLLSDAHLFIQSARKALGTHTTMEGSRVEIVDGGIVFEVKGEPAIIQWAKKPTAR